LFSGLIILLMFQFWSLWLAQYSVTILLYLIAPLVFISLFGIIQRKKSIIGFGIGLIVVLGIIAATILTPLFLDRNNEKPDNNTGDTNYYISTESLGLETVGRRVVHWKNTVDLVLNSHEVPFSDDRLSSFHLVHALSKSILSDDIEWDIEYEERKVHVWHSQYRERGWQ